MYYCYLSIQVPINLPKNRSEGESDKKPYKQETRKNFFENRGWSFILISAQCLQLRQAH